MALIELHPAGLRVFSFASSRLRVFA